MLGLSKATIVTKCGRATKTGTAVIEYLAHRANVLNSQVESRLMDGSEARRLFNTLKRELKPTCPLPMNKQRGDKKQRAYFTGIINMLIDANAQGTDWEHDPRSLTSFIVAGRPEATLARQFDGVFASTVNPVAVWEIKEYYYTTTFGSRVADAVYETQLDGMELADLRKRTGVQVDHVLMIDSREWWIRGKSYLCRIIDLLHMGYVSEVLVGREVVDRIPTLVQEWVRRAQQSND